MGVFAHAPLPHDDDSGHHGRDKRDAGEGQGQIGRSGIAHVHLANGIALRKRFAIISLIRAKNFTKRINTEQQ